MVLTANDRIQLTSMKYDPYPIEPGTKGTVKEVMPGIFDDETYVDVQWDNGRTLGLVLPIDECFKIG